MGAWLVRTRRLSGAEWALLLEAAALLLVVRVGLSALAVGRLRRWLARAVPSSPDGERRGARDEPVGVGLAVSRASRLVPGAACLAQALTAEALLRRRGWAGTIRVGFARAEDGRLSGHAWLEVDGRTVLGAEPGGRDAAFAAAAVPRP